MNEIAVAKNDRTTVSVGGDIENATAEAVESQPGERIVPGSMLRARIAQQIGRRIADPRARAENSPDAAHDDGLPLGELIPVAPCGDLGPQRRPDAYQLEPFAQPGE